MKKLLIIFALLFFFTNQLFLLSNPSNKYSKEAKINILNEIASNIYARIDDDALNKNQPTENILILTKILLDEEKTKEYNSTLSLKNRNDDIHDFITYKIIGYSLKNEKNESLKIMNNIPTERLGETSLTKENDKIYQDLYININLDKTYKKLSGKIEIEFQIYKDIKKSVILPIQISI